jgi:hypothetical protein
MSMPNTRSTRNMPRNWALISMNSFSRSRIRANKPSKSSRCSPQSGAIDVIIVDSVAALVPQAELDGVMEDNQVGLQARLMSKAMRKLAGILAKTGCMVMFINQLREKVGVMYGNPETTTGGRALKFYASIRLICAGPMPSKTAPRSSATPSRSKS